MRPMAAPDAAAAPRPPSAASVEGGTRGDGNGAASGPPAPSRMPALYNMPRERSEPPRAPFHATGRALARSRGRAPSVTSVAAPLAPSAPQTMIAAKQSIARRAASLGDPVPSTIAVSAMAESSALERAPARGGSGAAAIASALGTERSPSHISASGFGGSGLIDALVSRIAQLQAEGELLRSQLARATALAGRPASPGVGSRPGSRTGVRHGAARRSTESSRELQDTSSRSALSAFGGPRLDVSAWARLTDAEEVDAAWRAREAALLEEVAELRRRLAGLPAGADGSAAFAPRGAVSASASAAAPSPLACASFQSAASASGGGAARPRTAGGAAPGALGLDSLSGVGAGVVYQPVLLQGRSAPAGFASLSPPAPGALSAQHSAPATWAAVGAHARGGGGGGGVGGAPSARPHTSGGDGRGGHAAALRGGAAWRAPHDARLAARERAVSAQTVRAAAMVRAVGALAAVRSADELRAPELRLAIAHAAGASGAVFFLTPEALGVAPAALADLGEPAGGGPARRLLPLLTFDEHVGLGLGAVAGTEAADGALCFEAAHGFTSEAFFGTTPLLVPRPSSRGPYVHRVDAHACAGQTPAALLVCPLLAPVSAGRGAGQEGAGTLSIGVLQLGLVHARPPAGMAATRETAAALQATGARTSLPADALDVGRALGYVGGLTIAALVRGSKAAGALARSGQLVMGGLAAQTLALTVTHTGPDEEESERARPAAPPQHGAAPPSPGQAAAVPNPLKSVATVAGAALTAARQSFAEASALAAGPDAIGALAAEVEDADMFLGVRMHGACSDAGDVEGSPAGAEAAGCASPHRVPSSPSSRRASLGRALRRRSVSGASPTPARRQRSEEMLGSEALAALTGGAPSPYPRPQQGEGVPPTLDARLSPRAPAHADGSAEGSAEGSARHGSEIADLLRGRTSSRRASVSSTIGVVGAGDTPLGTLRLGGAASSRRRSCEARYETVPTAVVAEAHGGAGAGATGAEHSPPASPGAHSRQLSRHDSTVSAVCTPRLGASSASLLSSATDQRSDEQEVDEEAAREAALLAEVRARARARPDAPSCVPRARTPVAVRGRERA